MSNCRRILLFAVALLAAGVAISPAVAQADAAAQQFNPRTVVPAMPAIVDVPVLLADEVRDQVSDNELVLGVVVGDQARAYPINMLTGPRREIINDTLGGSAIAATW